MSNKMNINETVSLARELAKAMNNNNNQEDADDSHYKIGENYIIRTVTFIYTGKLVKVTEKDIVLIDAAWIAETARWADTLKNGDLEEVEPYPDGVEVILPRGAGIDICRWNHDLPRDQK